MERNKKRLVLKICAGTWENESRDKRELSLYKELGYNVVVLAKNKGRETKKLDRVDGFVVHRMQTKPLGNRIPKRLNQLVSLFTWAFYARRLRPEIVSGHDLPGLLIAWISSFWMVKKPLLIYDSHEYEAGRNADRSGLQIKLIKELECFLIKRCAFSIMVNNTIADKVQELYKLRNRPIVVRSTPNNWVIDRNNCSQNRDLFIDSFAQKGEKVSCLLMYHGVIVKNRGIEILIKSVSQFDDIGLIILGNGDEDYITSLRGLIRENKLEGRVLFHSSVPLRELGNYVGCVDISIVPIELNKKSYYYSLPNKLFESIQSMTPVIASDLPEIKQIIQKYGVGLTFRPGDPHDLSKCIQRMKTDKCFYAQCKQNLIQAKNELCWEVEKRVLIQEMKKIERIYT